MIETTGRRPGAANGPPDPTAAPDEAVEVRLVGVAPKVVSPAWELELLISGAVTFGLLQVPGAIDAARESLMPRVTGAAEAALLFATLYSKGTVYALLATFLLNLTARAYWVGLVGLQSVYPAGPRWEEYRSGPYLRAVYRRRMRPLPEVIGRVDDFASVLFSFGFLIAMIVVGACAFAALLGGSAWALTRLVPALGPTERVFKALFAAAFVPLIGVSLVDKYVGPRLRPDGAGARALARAVRVSYVLGGGAAFGPVFITLFTNLRGKTFYPVFTLAFFGTMLLAGGEFLADNGKFDSGVAVYAPEDADRRGLHPVHYESMRRPGDRDVATSIQSDVIGEPYARLFIPYDAERLNAVVPARCPGVRPQRAAGFHLVRARAPADSAASGRAADAVLACLARIYRVHLDGRPLDALRFRFTSHPVAGTPGVVAHVPLAGLAAGEHRLTVHPAPPPPGSGRRGGAPLDIPFWR